MTLTPEFSKVFASKISNLIVRRLQGMSEKEVKHCSKDQVDNLLFDLNQLLYVGMTQQERAWIVETTELSIALRFLKSTNLEKRLKGLQDIKFMIERVIKTERNAYFRQKTNWSTTPIDADMEASKVPETGYLNTSLIC